MSVVGDSSNGCVKSLYYYKGVPLLPDLFPKSNLLALDSFEVREDDVFIISYPKSGTTWMQQIVALILNNDNLDRVRDTPMTKLVPFLEITRGGVPQHEYITSMPESSPRAINTHLADHILPPQIWQKKPKIIYVARNPKDIMVSYYEFKLHDAMTWDEWFDRFLAGEVCFGSWFELVPNWLKRRQEPNLCLCLYEDMHQNLRENVQRVARFLEIPLEDSVVDEITRLSTFEVMRHAPVSTSTLVNKKQQSMLRKGIVGDWKNYFTVTQNETFERVYRERLAFFPDLDVFFEHIGLEQPSQWAHGTSRNMENPDSMKVL
ncbi:sulfotransferase 1B1-like isoform X2 [Ptychodera flava]|uniref:sulfotransferase 1B1-like isoform X2 n=1 Tax=Ptychodera flava TaxID=63121 RepID=UPI003969ED63